MKEKKRLLLIKYWTNKFHINILLYIYSDGAGGKLFVSKYVHMYIHIWYTYVVHIFVYIISVIFPMWGSEGYFNIRMQMCLLSLSLKVITEEIHLILSFGDARNRKVSVKISIFYVHMSKIFINTTKLMKYNMNSIIYA